MRDETRNDQSRLLSRKLETEDVLDSQPHTNLQSTALLRIVFNSSDNLHHGGFRI